MNLSLNLNQIPAVYEHVHKYDSHGYQVLFNAKANMYSMAIVNNVEYEFFNMIDGKKSFKQLLSKLWFKKNKDKVGKTIEYLLQKNIIHCLDKEPKIDVSPSKTGSIWLHVSNQCNLRCTYCYIEKTNSHLDTDMGKIYVKKAFKMLQKQGMTAVNVKLAGGEPTLRFEQTMKMIDYLYEIGPKFGLKVEITILSNGTLITEERAQRLLKKRVNVSVSLDGIDESNNVNRPYTSGKGSVDKVLEGIATLSEFGVNINISIVITPQTVEHFPEVVRFCLERELPYIIQFARENTFSVGEVQADNERLITGMRNVFEVIRQNFPKHSLLHAHLDNVSFSKAHSEPVCGVDNNYIVISEKGQVSACHMFMDKPVGSILDEDISEKLFTAKTVTDGITSEEKEGCSTCEWRYICSGSCPATTKLTYGSAGRKSPFCHSYKVLIPELIKLEAERVISLASI